MQYAHPSEHPLDVVEAETALAVLHDLTGTLWQAVDLVLT
jgi:hypothetical protein